MKKLCVVLSTLALLVGCGTAELEQDNPALSERIDEVVTETWCASTCPATGGWVPIAYACSSTCQSSCSGLYYQVTCTQVAHAGQFQHCNEGSSNCASVSHYASQIYYASDCQRSGTSGTALNAATCMPVPTSGSYTKCGPGECAPGFYASSFLYVQGCNAREDSNPTNNNATVCVKS
jgi:hypothetical protein